MCFIPMFGWYNYENLPKPANASIVCQFLTVVPMSYMVYIHFLVGTVLPLLVMAVLYVAIFCTIRGSLREKPGNKAQNESRAYLRKEKQLAGSLALVLALFIVCWLPLDVMNCVAYFGSLGAVPEKAFYVGIVMSHANSAVNPVVYAFKVEKIKRAYLAMWRRASPCRDENQSSQIIQTTDNNLSSNANNGV